MNAEAPRREQGLARLRERAPAAAELIGKAPALRDSAAAVLDASDFILDALGRDPALAPALCARADAALAGAMALPVAEAEAEFAAALRRWRRAELTRIAWRDLAGWSSLAQTLEELSAAADAALLAASEFATGLLSARYGVPRGAGGQPLKLLIIAMGKLGGRELNFSSDVDLLFLFPEHGATDGAAALSNEEFFLRVAQRLIRLIDQVGDEGFVYRIDTRLRPFGDSGPLVTSFAALEDYLQAHGRDWERYAWIKARAVTGSEYYGPLFRATIQPFVYRRYLDFGVFESLREMKALIAREVQRRELSDDIKLGPGGIREIEFIVQAFQLIRGGQDARLQDPSLLRTLPRLQGSRLLPEAVAQQLAAAYEFLRRLENRLQQRADEQTHRLPGGEPARTALAAAMGLPGWPELVAELDAHRRRVAEHFADVVTGAVAGQSRGRAPGLPPLFDGRPDRDAIEAALTAMGFAESSAIAQLLVDLGTSALRRRLDDAGVRRLGALLPALVADAAAAPAPLDVLRRLCRILEAIGPRSAYFALLLENAAARARLVQIAGHGDFLTAQIAAHPLLLDELIDERLLEQLPTRERIAQELRQRLEGLGPADAERQVELLVQGQRAAVFRIAVADLGGRISVMQVSDQLTGLAELVLEEALRLSWEQLGATLGVPRCGEGAQRRDVRICVIGYGKLGGIELGYGSDLDLVFLHDSAGAQQCTDGPQSGDNQVFFVRFAQRLVHLLTMHSAAGRLYEVDVRLRPSGKGGLLITNIQSFAEYQRQEAWTWEHQALLHARAVAGDGALRARFEGERLQILQHHVRRDTLREEVRGMRQRMRDELSRSQAGQFDLKQDPGGIADIEFLAQYWALKWADRYPPVVWFSDTIRQLESVASAALEPQSDVDLLTGAYRLYRARVHRRSLDGEGPVVADTEFAAERDAVSALWEREMRL
jgi:glutamate-ammonia-ligase adenylyltransferase